MQQQTYSADLVRIHEVIDRGLRVAIEHGYALNRGTPAIGATRDGYSRYVAGLLALIVAHHEAENRVAWPILRRYLPDAPYATLVAQHREIAEVTATAETALDDDAVDVLVVQLTELQALWHAHVDLEERVFLEASANAFGPAQQDELLRRLARDSQAHAEPATLIVPFMLYNLPREERTRAADMVPAAAMHAVAPQTWMEAWTTMRPFFI